MNLENIARRPHVDGYLWLDAPSDGETEPSFRITHTYHASAGIQGAAPRSDPPPFVTHPLQEHLLAAAQASRPQGRARAAGNAGARLASIPVRVLFDTPEHNVMARYEGWSKLSDLQPTCIGNGQCAKALAATGAWSQIACRGPDLCPHVRSGQVQCAPAVRMLVQVQGAGETQHVLEFRCASVNSYRSLLGTLAQLQAQGAALRSLPLTLSGWIKSARASEYQAFACAQLQPQHNEHQGQHRAGVDQALNGTGSQQTPGSAQAGREHQWEQFGAMARQQWLGEAIATEWDMRSPATGDVVAANDAHAAVPLLANAGSGGVRARASTVLALHAGDASELFAGPLQQAHERNTAGAESPGTSGQGAVASIAWGAAAGSGGDGSAGASLQTDANVGDFL